MSHEPAVGGISFLLKTGPWHREGEAVFNDTSLSQISQPPSPPPDTHPSQNQIWSLHSLLEIPGASSHLRVKSWLLCGPESRLDKPSQPGLLLSSLWQPQPCHILSHFHVSAHAVPSAQSAFPTLPCPPNSSSTLRTWLRALAPGAVRSSRRQATVTPGTPLTGLASRAQRLVLSESKPVSDTQLVLSTYLLNE